MAATPLPPAGVPFLDENNNPTLPWRRALQSVGDAASGGVTPAELAAVEAQALAAQATAAAADLTANEALAKADEPDPLTLPALSASDGFLTVSAAFRLARPRTFSYTGDATGGPTPFDGSANVSTALTLANTAVTPGTYGDATHVGQFTVDAKGRLTFAQNVALTGTGVTSFNGETGAIVVAAGSNITITESPANTFTFAATGGGTGTVTHTGALTSGELVFGNGTADITVGNLSGDVTTSGSGATTLATVATPGTNTKITFNAKGLVTSGAAAVLASSDFANQGTTTTLLHGNAAGNPSWAAVDLAADVTGNLGVSHLNSGTSASSSTFWRGDGTWATPAGAGTVTNTGTLTANRLILGNGSADVTVLGSLGTTTTLLHGNAGGAPIFGAVDLTADVTGVLPTANQASQTGRLIGIQVFSTAGTFTYTPTSGANSVVIHVQGAGGGGGGSPQPGLSKVSNASNGAGGAWGQIRLTSNFSGGTVVVGSKGTAGSAGANAGNNGGNSSFTNTAGSPVSWIAGGGTGGFAGATGATPPTFAFAVTGGVVSGTGTFDISMSGGDSAQVASPQAGQIYSIPGGSSFFSKGSPAGNLFTANSQVTGVNATGFGGGGTAALVTGTGAATKGGDGSVGLVVIYEYS